MKSLHLKVALTLLLCLYGTVQGQDMRDEEPSNLQEFGQLPTARGQFEFFYQQADRYSDQSPYDWLDVVTQRYNQASQEGDTAATRLYEIMQAELFHDLRSYDRSVSLVNELLTDLVEAQDSNLQAILLELQERNFKSLKLYEKQLEVRKMMQDLGITDKISFYDIYEALGNYRKAMNLYIAERKSQLDPADLIGQARYQNDVGLFLIRDKSAATGQSYMIKALGYVNIYLNEPERIESGEDLEEARRLKAIIEGNMGRSHVQLNQFSESLPFLENSIASMRGASSDKDLAIVAENRLALAEAYLQMSNPDKAVEYLRQQEEPELIPLRLKFNRLWADYYEQKEDLQAQVRSLKKNARIRDSLEWTMDALEKQQLLALVSQEELESTNKANSRLQLTLESRDALLQAQDTQINLVFISLVFTLLGFAGLVYAYLKNIKNQRLMAEQKHFIEKSLVEKDSLLKEIHHRVKNNLQMVSSLLSLQAKNTRSRAAIEALEEGKTRVKAMALIHQKLYQNDDLSVIEMQGYIESLINSVQSVFKKGGHNINITIDAEGVELDIDRAIPIGLILNELVSNSFKYAFPDPEQEGMIYIHIRKNGGGGFFEYTDNGVGMSEESEERAENSMGIRLMRRLVNQLQSTLNIDKLEQGVRFWFNFK
ncbi:histidine kinase dimerization/phosphoacceptor domain -containing protein [Robiginitalea sp. M366]|uniref:sensor histidine kinase n=1 Tax=Robiginitalea aestuariiviva TaxID=3036903 RepID=UPI00240D27D1|nr:histidine kinase dimerization/phosphoacceptor domain -containing protein [Robiginitalea aestuariiviva]MDG1573073.1 histidine kinase dimerization/phosphoacceptor domain -containing protein [Robiginitalea aestuariiviva]